MRKAFSVSLMSLAMVIACGSFLRAEDKPAAGTAQPLADWSMNATIIEACSCPMFCQCYFDTKPAAHSAHEGHEHHHADATAATAGGAEGAGEHFCKMDNAYRV